jgi:hypothetical protein
MKLCHDQAIDVTPGRSMFEDRRRTRLVCDFNPCHKIDIDRSEFFKVLAWLLEGSLDFRWQCGCHNG